MILIHPYKEYNIARTGTDIYPWNIYKQNGSELGEHISFGRTLKECIEDINNNCFLLEHATSLSEQLDDDYEWISTLEEELIEEDWFNEANNANSREYNPRDIVMVNEPSSGIHRILIITKIENKENPIYRGYILSSNVSKANKNSRYSNNIYINDYSTILEYGPRYNKEAIIKLDELKEFTRANFSSSGTYKGTVTEEFFNFILSCIRNMKTNTSNKNIFWER